MSEFEDVTIKSVGFAGQEGYPWYPVSVTLSRIPDKRWENCFDEIFQQRMEQISDNMVRALDLKKDELELAEDTVSSIEPLYELRGDVLTFRWVYGRDSKDGMKARLGSEELERCLLCCASLTSCQHIFRTPSMRTGS
jgi:hypothetical protein